MAACTERKLVPLLAAPTHAIIPTQTEQNKKRDWGPEEVWGVFQEFVMLKDQALSTGHTIGCPSLLRKLLPSKPLILKQPLG